MNSLAEEWRPVNGYEGQYEVSNLGLPVIRRELGSNQFVQNKPAGDA